MNIDYFQNVFGAWKGYVYQYLGNLDGVESIHTHVTDKFVEVYNHPEVISTVVEVKPGMVVLFTQDLVEDSNEFKMYCNLLMPAPEVVVETPPAEESTPQ
jgi:hypothetical protein